MVLFKYQYALPYNKIASLLKQTCGLPVSDSGLSQGVLRLSQRFQGEAEALIETIRGSPALNIDETSWRTSVVNDYLWIFTDQFHTAYKIIHSRGRQVVLDTLDEGYQRTINFDFFSAYNPLLTASRSVSPIWDGNFTKSSNKMIPPSSTG